MVTRIDFWCEIQHGPTEGPEKRLFILNHFGEPKVAYLDLDRVIRGEEDVIWFDVAMRNAPFVDVHNSPENLPRHLLDQMLFHFSMLVDVVIQVTSTDVLHYDVYVCVVFEALMILNNIWLQTASVCLRRNTSGDRS